MKPKLKIRPLGDRIVVEMDQETEVQKGGIYIPETSQKTSRKGRIVALGTGGLLPDGTALPFNVKVGEVVLMPQYGGTQVDVDDKRYYIVREIDILGVLD